MRTKGMAISLTVDYAAVAANQYLNPRGFLSMGFAYYYVSSEVLASRTRLRFGVLPQAQLLSS